MGVVWVSISDLVCTLKRSTFPEQIFIIVKNKQKNYGKTKLFSEIDFVFLV